MFYRITVVHRCLLFSCFLLSVFLCCEEHITGCANKKCTLYHIDATVQDKMKQIPPKCLGI